MKTDEVRLYAVRGGLTTKMVRTAHFGSHKVFRCDQYIFYYLRFLHANTPAAARAAIPANAAAPLTPVSGLPFAGVHAGVSTAVSEPSASAVTAPVTGAEVCPAVSPDSSE